MCRPEVKKADLHFSFADLKLTKADLFLSFADLELRKADLQSKKADLTLRSATRFGVKANRFSELPLSTAKRARLGKRALDAQYTLAFGDFGCLDHLTFSKLKGCAFE